ncbi:MAG TPA: hypothetical protein VGO93_25545 [Candidatus Xenobia bacterium]
MSLCRLLRDSHEARHRSATLLLDCGVPAVYLLLTLRRRELTQLDLRLHLVGEIVETQCRSRASRR